MAGPYTGRCRPAGVAATAQDRRHCKRFPKQIFYKLHRMSERLYTFRSPFSSPPGWGGVTGIPEVSPLDTGAPYPPSTLLTRVSITQSLDSVMKAG